MREAIPTSQQHNPVLLGKVRYIFFFRPPLKWYRSGEENSKTTTITSMKPHINQSIKPLNQY